MAILLDLLSSGTWVAGYGGRKVGMMTNRSLLILGLFSLVVLLFLWLPLGFVLQKGASVEAFAKLFSRDDIWAAAGESVFLAISSGALTTVIGLMIALALPRVPASWGRYIQGGIIFPMVLPEIAIALSFMVWFVKLGMPFGQGTLLASHVAFSLSYSVLLLKVRVESLDVSLMEAARDLGAHSGQVFMHGLLPQLFPAIMASFLTCFSLSLDDFLISFFVKGIDNRLLPIQIYSMMRLGLSREIYALSLLLFCISLGVVLTTQVWKKRRS